MIEVREFHVIVVVYRPAVPADSRNYDAVDDREIAVVAGHQDSL